MVSGNHGNHGNDKNHGNPACKQQIPRPIGKRLMGGGGKYLAIFWGKTYYRALQNQFWRPQKVGLVWSAPVSSKENSRA